MKAQTVGLKESTGRILCSTIFHAGGRKLLAKGHVMNEHDIQLLEAGGLRNVWVTELEEGEVGEDAAVSQASAEMGCGCLEIRLAAGGRANLFATEDCCVLVDQELLNQINYVSTLVIATSLNFSFARTGQRIATVKSTPFVVAQSRLEVIMHVLKERGPILQARPLRDPYVAVLYSDPVQGEHARQLFERFIRQRLERFSVISSFELSTIEEEDAVARSLHHLLRAKPTVVLVASTTAPAGPGDVIGRAMTRIGCHMERFLAPVEPGNLLLLGYYDEVPIVSAPGCFRSTTLNVVDLILPPTLARYRISASEVAALRHGGLLG